MFAKIGKKKDIYNVAADEFDIPTDAVERKNGLPSAKQLLIIIACNPDDDDG